MYNFWLNWDKFWYKLLAKPEILSTSLVVPRGNVSPLCAKRYTLPPPLSFFIVATHNYMSALLNFGIIPGSFGLFYTLIEFLDI